MSAPEGNYIQVKDSQSEHYWHLESNNQSRTWLSDWTITFLVEVCPVHYQTHPWPLLTKASSSISHTPALWPPKLSPGDREQNHLHLSLPYSWESLIYIKVYFHFMANTGIAFQKPLYILSLRTKPWFHWATNHSDVMVILFQNQK